MNDAKHFEDALQEVKRLLDELSDASMLTKTHIDRFVDRIEVLRDGRVYVGVIPLYIDNS